MENLLQIRNLTKVFGEGTINEKVALDGLSLDVAPGDFITIIGNNGAGKSTLLNCISGVFPVDKGEIIIDGKDCTKQSESKRALKIGRVFQDPLKGTAFDMTIEENLAIAASKNKRRGLQPGITKRDREAFRKQLSELDMGLEDVMTKRVKLLSGGQRQALTLFMAVISQPALLLLDEHTAALDPAAAEKVLALTEKFSKKDNMCTLMITHNMKDALKYGNRTILMKNGKIVMDIKGKEREEMTVDKLIEKFSIDNDRMIL